MGIFGIGIERKAIARGYCGGLSSMVRSLRVGGWTEKKGAESEGRLREIILPLGLFRGSRIKTKH